MAGTEYTASRSLTAALATFHAQEHYKATYHYRKVARPLRGKTALIYGAGGPVGDAVARTFAAEGFIRGRGGPEGQAH